MNSDEIKRLRELAGRVEDSVAYGNKHGWTQGRAQAVDDAERDLQQDFEYDDLLRLLDDYEALQASHARLLEAVNTEAQHMEAAADVTGDKVHEKWLLERARALRAAIKALLGGE